MGEKKRKTLYQGAHGVVHGAIWPMAAQIFVIGQAASHLSQFAMETPSIAKATWFQDAERDWRQTGSDCLLIVWRKDKRFEILHSAGDTASLKVSIERVLADYHARRQCCEVRLYLGQADAVRQACTHEHPAIPYTISAPKLKHLAGGPMGEIFTVEIARKSVEAMETVGLLRHLDTLFAGAEAIKRHGQKVMLIFEGYNDDPREIWEVAEVRAYVTEISARAPWWPVLTHPSAILTYFGCLASIQRSEKDTKGQVYLVMDPKEAERTAFQFVSNMMPFLLCTDMPRDDLKTLASAVITQLKGFAMRLGKGTDIGLYNLARADDKTPAGHA